MSLSMEYLCLRREDIVNIINFLVLAQGTDFSIQNFETDQHLQERTPFCPNDFVQVDSTHPKKSLNQQLTGAKIKAKQMLATPCKYEKQMGRDKTQKLGFFRTYRLKLFNFYKILLNLSKNLLLESSFNFCKGTDIIDDEKDERGTLTDRRLKFLIIRGHFYRLLGEKKRKTFETLSVDKQKVRDPDMFCTTEKMEKKESSEVHI
ncbi:hypothetical protein RUM44_010551 [Polyplax serrata]|uniref:Uncharacterized protein n=1 Tax=Polyplax serrata TaxID=468196 RepID=A0ABR1AVU4_POLSC